ncbi:MAG: L,D-transpeptidase [Rhizobiales bacterium]|nr:L,D-transpeptidase [Hyphomicrobiales bacterium]
MRKLWIPVVFLGVAFAMEPALAGKLQFPPDTFEIYGGLGNSPTKGKRTTRTISYSGAKTVDFKSDLSPGSILVRTRDRRLYYILPDGKAIEYAVGVGREGFTWSGRNKISRKAVWPDWRPPAEMIEREAANGHYIPDFMPGGPDNPLGARALYIGDTEFRIHGTAQPWTIGGAVSSGCIRMLNEEVIDLYDRARVGALVVVE